MITGKIGMKRKAFCVSGEQQIIRFAGGIKIIRPDQSLDNTAPTLDQIKKLPFSAYLLDRAGATQSINEEGALICGFDSSNAAIGKTLHNVSAPESANRLIDNCSRVIETNCMAIFEEDHLRKDEVSQQFLSVKAPWYNDENNIIGVFGCSIVLGKHSLAESLNTISQLGLLHPNNQAPILSYSKISQVYLSKREQECLRLTIKGYTAKRIARELGISNRTVEEYLNSIRIKTGSSSKLALIEMVLDGITI